MNRCAKKPCNPCKQGCEPARYSQGFGQDNGNGAVSNTNRAAVKQFETDTTLSIDTPNSTLNYKAERHTDKLTGQQIGGIIRFEDLRDTRFNYDFTSHCAEAIFRRYGECGDGCRSLEDAWTTFALDDEGAKQPSIRYVRGANAYGCPVYLDTPSREMEFWYAGWTPTGQHTYYQPRWVDKGPRIDDDPVYLTEDPDTKELLATTFPLSCLLDNLMQNFGLETNIGFQVIQATPQYEAKMNNTTGEFDIMWNDWFFNFTQHVGTGHIIGKVNWDYSFNRKDGDMSFVVRSVHFDRVYYKTDKGCPESAAHIFLTLDGLEVGGSGRVSLLNRYEFTGRSDWTVTLNKTINWNSSFTLKPGDSMGPFNFLYMWVDWYEFDDEGYLNLNFRNRLNGWLGDCF